jgi:hypothetical protein
VPTATAAVEEIFVTQPLDADLDLSTFALGDFGFGPLTVSVPAGRQSYHTVVAFHNPDGSPLNVDVTAALDPAAAVVKWTFTCIDPATGAFPEDPFAGFLPPDDAAGNGEGFVTYSVRPKAGLATGTAIDAQASIVFDLNPVIPTNAYTNTIDAGRPVSTIFGLPAVTNTASFLVQWSGADDVGGSGVGTFDVYVSDNGGVFTLWQSATPATSAVYSAQNGHTYSFYSVATDNVGNRQTPPAGGQASTTVNAKPPLVSSVVIDDGSAQRSMVRSLSVTFNEVVTLGAGAFDLRTTGGAAVALTRTVNVVNGQTVVVLTFTGPDIVGGSLADGRYTLKVVGSQVTDSLGNLLDGDGDGQAGGDNLTALLRYYGEVNGDGVVNGADFGFFRPAFGTTAGNPAYLAYLDYDGDGAINGTDFAQFRSRFGMVLP